jgi:hypothetical protein
MRSPGHPSRGLGSWKRDCIFFFSCWFWILIFCGGDRRCHRHLCGQHDWRLDLLRSDDRLLDLDLDLLRLDAFRLFGRRWLHHDCDGPLALAQPCRAVHFASSRSSRKIASISCGVRLGCSVSKHPHTRRRRRRKKAQPRKPASGNAKKSPLDVAGTATLPASTRARIGGIVGIEKGG